MTLRQKCSTTSVVGSISLLVLATTFSACVPVDPPGPVATRLNFVFDDGTNSYLKSWDPATGQVAVMVTSSMTNGSLEVISGQPDGAAVVYRTGVSNVVQVGSFYTVAENAAGQYVKKYVKPHSGPNEAPPVWSPDGTHLAWGQADSLRVQELGGIPKRFGALAYAPMWSPDSNKIIYSKPTTIGDATSLRVYDIATGQDVEVFPRIERAVVNGVYGYARYRWLSDSRHVVISGAKHILIDTTAPALTPAQEIGTNEGDIIPSPAGDRFVLVSGEPYLTSIRTYSLAFADGSAPIPLADAFDMTAPSWSATGDRLHIVTDAGNDGVLDIVTLNADGQQQQSVATGMPALRYAYSDNFTQVYNSPSNDKFAFTYVTTDGVSETLRLTVVDEPSGAIHSFSAVSTASSPVASWSPDGRYLSWGGDFHDLYLYDSNSPAATSKLMNIDAERLGLRAASWSRDSKHIALCRGAEYYSCPLTVISITAGNLTYTALPDIANGFLWTGKK